MKQNESSLLHEPSRARSDSIYIVFHDPTDDDVWLLDVSNVGGIGLEASVCAHLIVVRSGIVGLRRSNNSLRELDDCGPLRLRLGMRAWGEPPFEISGQSPESVNHGSQPSLT
jgi:hypothetical protein